LHQQPVRSLIWPRDSYPGRLPPFCLRNILPVPGIYETDDSLSQVLMQDHYNDVVTELNEALNDNYDDIDHGYTRNVFSALCNAACTYEVLSITYYDDYFFAIKNSDSTIY